MFEIDQPSVLEQISTPVLLIQAGQDLNVSGQQAGMLAKTKPNISYKTYADIDHSFKHSDGSSKVEAIIEDI